ncbi:N-acetylneuraminate synthase [Candidatus Woesearchaeota archaeon]|nr:N-acetylneuraminate synthase [Candidatus Woesearchaeota archaeon]
MSNYKPSDLGLSDNSCYIIAEVAQAHDGSLGLAHAYIDAIADAGADAVKFQTHIAKAESTLDEPWRVKFSSQDKSRYDYWKRMEFSAEQWLKLAEHSRSLGLDFWSSPFSIEAAIILQKIGIKQWKIGSGEIYNPILVDYLLDTRLPILFSSGMSSIADLDNVINQAIKKSTPFGIFQCSSSYPTPPELWGLEILSDFRERYNCPVGLSDHSGGIYAGLAATTLGADFIEVHVTFDKKMFGPDVTSSITISELEQLVLGSKSIRLALNNKDDKDTLVSSTSNLKKTFGRSLALVSKLPSGTKLSKRDLTLKKPGSGILYDDINKVIGRSLKTHKGIDKLLTWDDLE